MATKWGPFHKFFFKLHIFFGFVQMYLKIVLMKILHFTSTILVTHLKNNKHYKKS
jgi:hypothetical protein